MDKTDIISKPEPAYSPQELALQISHNAADDSAKTRLQSRTIGGLSADSIHYAELDANGMFVEGRGYSYDGCFGWLPVSHWVPPGAKKRKAEKMPSRSLNCDREAA